jgi:hypothetical protein
MVEAEVRPLVQAHLPEGSGHGGPTSGQERADDQHLHFAPRPARKSWLKRM